MFETILTILTFVKLLYEQTFKFLLKWSLNAHYGQAGLIPESRCEFRNDRGTIILIFKQDNFKRNVKNIMMTST